MCMIKYFWASLDMLPNIASLIAFAPKLPPTTKIIGRFLVILCRSNTIFLLPLNISFPTGEPVKIAFLPKEFFKGDFSRVIYSAQDIVFRRRIELLDSGKDGEQMNVTNLNLPFCSYMQVGDPEEDDRLATKNASLAVLGIYQEDLGKNLRTVAVKTKYKATLFFHRRDDIRLAHQLMFWDSPSNRRNSNPLSSVLL